jgi:IS30 family transposase
MAGRPEIKIDWKKVGNLLKAQCIGTGIASMLGVSPDTLYRKCQEDHKTNFEDYSRQKKSEGVELLRAKQFQTAMEGDKTLLIWLGKQYLDQKDKAQSDITTNGKDISAGLTISKEDIRKISEALENEC